MLKRNQSWGGIDVGSESVRVAIVKQSSSGITKIPTGGNSSGNIVSKLSVVGVGIASSYGIRRGVVINSELARASIAEAIGLAQTQARFELQEYALTIAGSHIETSVVNGVVNLPKRTVGARDIERVLEDAQQLGIPKNREDLHVLPREFRIDGRSCSGNPCGYEGGKLEAKVAVVTSDSSSTQTLLNCVNQSGYSVTNIFTSPLALGESMTQCDERLAGVMLVDIGAGTTDVIYYKQGLVVFIASIPLGGNNITVDLSRSLRIPIEVAEKLKCNQTTVEPMKLENRGSSISVQTYDEVRMVSFEQIRSAVIPRVDEIINSIRKVIEDNGGGDNLRLQKIVLTGGTSRLKGLQERFRTMFGVEVHQRGVSSSGKEHSRKVDVQRVTSTRDGLNDGIPGFLGGELDVGSQGGEIFAEQITELGLDCARGACLLASKDGLNIGGQILSRSRKGKLARFCQGTKNWVAEHF